MYKYIYIYILHLIYIYIYICMQGALCEQNLAACMTITHFACCKIGRLACMHCKTETREKILSHVIMGSQRHAL